MVPEPDNRVASYFLPQYFMSLKVPGNGVPLYGVTLIFPRR